MEGASPERPRSERELGCFFDELDRVVALTNSALEALGARGEPDGAEPSMD